MALQVARHLLLHWDSKFWCFYANGRLFWLPHYILHLVLVITLLQLLWVILKARPLHSRGIGFAGCRAQCHVVTPVMHTSITMAVDSARLVLPESCIGKHT
jgi:hypothetical protein